VLSNGKLKPGSLRLQVSVVRERHGLQASVTEGKFNGVYVLTAQQAVDASAGAVQVVCVDEPELEQPGHALVALVAAPGAKVPEDAVGLVRSNLAQVFTCVTPPTKP
jgi:hypothetical protein